MKTIQILGTGCPKCHKLEENAREAIAGREADYCIVKVSEINEIMKFGVMMTPALALDGAVIAKGKVLSAQEIRELLL
jgi:small redox-active disulfide protein 2